MSLILFVVLISVVCGKQTPPDPEHAGSSGKLAPETMPPSYSSWTPQSHCNIWELSGQVEGDIMMEEDSARNALSDRMRLWPGGVVPYYIDPEDFDKDDRKIIKDAMEDIEDETCIKFRRYQNGDKSYVVIRGDKNGCWSYVGRKNADKDDRKIIKDAMEDIEDETCIKFRRYQNGDKSYVVIRGDKNGCWSYVGRKNAGQTLNLGEKCVRHGVAVHELLHVLGLHHQQSTFNRDDYVIIHWENIEDGHTHNFDKYNSSTVSDYGTGYDYESIMHYSAYAFSKNDKMTMTPKDKGVKIGQRKSLSKKDIQKVNAMYKCSYKKKRDEDEESSDMSSLVDILSIK